MSMPLCMNDYRHLQENKSKRLCKISPWKLLCFPVRIVVRDSYHFDKILYYLKSSAYLSKKKGPVWVDLIWDEIIVVTDTKITYFANKSDFQYKIIVVRGRDVALFRHNCRSVLKNQRNLGAKKISDNNRAEVRI